MEIKNSHSPKSKEFGPFHEDSSNISSRVNHVLLNENIFESPVTFYEFLYSERSNEEKTEIIFLQTIKHKENIETLILNIEYLINFLGSRLPIETKNNILETLFEVNPTCFHILVSEKRYFKIFLNSRYDNEQKIYFLAHILHSDRSLSAHFLENNEIMQCLFSSHIEELNICSLICYIIDSHEDIEIGILLRCQIADHILQSPLTAEGKAILIMKLLSNNNSENTDAIISQGHIHAILSTFPKQERDYIVSILITDCKKEINQLFTLLKLQETGYTSDNLYIFLIFYSNCFIADSQRVLDKEIENYIITTTEEHAEEIYNQIFSDYIDFLKNKDRRLLEVIELLNELGTGSLTQLESLIEFFHAILNTPDETPGYQEVCENLLEIHSIDNKRKIDRNKNSRIFDLGIDFFNCDPKLAYHYFSLINYFPGTLRSYYIDHVFTPHHILFTLLQERDDNGILYNGDRILEFVESHMNTFVFGFKSITSDGKDISEENVKAYMDACSEEVFRELHDLIQEKFGISHIPEITSENIHKITQTIKIFSKYYTNLSSQDEMTTLMLGLACGLKLNNLYWDFKNGKAIAYEQYFLAEYAQIYDEIFNKKSAKYSHLGQFYSPNLTSQECEILNHGITTSNIGHKQTISQKLQHIQSAVLTLKDSDFYPEEEKWVIEFLENNGNKNISKALGNTYHHITQNKPLSPEDSEIIERLEHYTGKITSKEQLITLQNIINIYYPLFNLIDIIDNFGIQSNIIRFEHLLGANTNIENIFTKLGEKTFGGSTQYTDIEKIITEFEKKKTLFTPIEVELFYEYILPLKEILEQFRTFILDLKTYLKRNKIIQEEKNLHNKYANLKINQRIKNVINVIYESGEKEDFSFLTTISGDIEIALEHIRGCLSIHKKENNNHTNLRFLAPNEFFITSYKVFGKENFADQVCTLLENESGIYFILDTLRGENKSEEINIAHIKALIKLIERTQRKDIQIFFPSNASNGNNISTQMLYLELLQAGIKTDISTTDGMTFPVVEQELYDVHYEWALDGYLFQKGDIPTEAGYIIKIVDE